jgi:hypothetical protein
MNHELNTDQAEIGTNAGRLGRTAVRKGGRLAGKWTGFSRFETALTHLFPQLSTQVVDFPRMYEVRVFWSSDFTAESQRRRAKRGKELTANHMKLASQARHEMGAPGELFAGAKRGQESARKFGLFHEVTRSFTKVRTDQARNSAIVRIITGGTSFLRSSQFKGAKEA